MGLGQYRMRVRYIGKMDCQFDRRVACICGIGITRGTVTSYGRVLVFRFHSKRQRDEARERLDNEIEAASYGFRPKMPVTTVICDSELDP